MIIQEITVSLSIIYYVYQSWQFWHIFCLLQGTCVHLCKCLTLFFLSTDPIRPSIAKHDKFLKRFFPHMFLLCLFLHTGSIFIQEYTLASFEHLAMVLRVFTTGHSFWFASATFIYILFITQLISCCNWKFNGHMSLAYK